MINMLTHYSILYVEDDLSIQKSIRSLLETYFGSVYVASDGLEAEEMYILHKPDCLFLDINLPKLNGMQLAKKIRKTNKRIPIVMLTAYTDPDKLLDAIDVNVTKYLVKPMNSLAFKESLRKIAQVLLEESKKLLRLKDGYTWYFDKSTLYKEDVKVVLTNKESLLLRYLADRHKECVYYEDIMAYVWADEIDQEISYDSVRNLAKDLRKKLPKSSLENVYSKGYVLV